MLAGCPRREPVRLLMHTRCMHAAGVQIHGMGRVGGGQACAARRRLSPAHGSAAVTLECAHVSALYVWCLHGALAMVGKSQEPPLQTSAKFEAHRCYQHAVGLWRRINQDLIERMQEFYLSSLCAKAHGKQ